MRDGKYVKVKKQRRQDILHFHADARKLILGSIGTPYIQHCMDLQLAVDPYKRRVLFESMDWLPKTHSQLTYFYKSNINQTFTIGGGMIWGVRTAIFTEIRYLVEELITLLSIFGPQKLSILTARLNKSLSISNSIQWDGISVLKHAQNLHSYMCIVRTTAFEKLGDGTSKRWCTPQQG